MISLTSPVKTAAHSWPAGGKLLAVCIATTMLFQLQSLVGQLVFFCCVGGLYTLPGTEFLKFGYSRLKGLWPFLAVIFLWHTVSGTTAQGLVISLRMLSAVALANLVTMTTRLSDMIAVVKWLLAPFRSFGIKTGALELAIAMVIRFTPVLAQKGQDLSMAWRARSAKRAGWQIITPFALLALDDSDHIAEALRARGGVNALEDQI